MPIRRKAVALSQRRNPWRSPVAMPAQIGEHRADIDRTQLAVVTKQHDLGIFPSGRKEAIEQRKTDHRGLSTMITSRARGAARSPVCVSAGSSARWIVDASVGIFAMTSAGAWSVPFARVIASPRRAAALPVGAISRKSQVGVLLDQRGDQPHDGRCFSGTRATRDRRKAVSKGAFNRVSLVTASRIAKEFMERPARAIAIDCERRQVSACADGRRDPLFAVKIACR